MQKLEKENKYTEAEREQYKKSRSSNIELLRIVAMLMIVATHIVMHCVNVQLTDLGSIARRNNGFFCQPFFYKKLLILVSFMPLGHIANAIFILISGYFMSIKGFDVSHVKIENRHVMNPSIDLGKIAKKLLIQLGFASVVLVIVSFICHGINGKIYVAMQDITFFNQMAWYIGYYFCVVVIGALFLNRFLATLDNKQYMAYLFTLFTIFSLSWSGGIIDSLAGGLRTLVLGIFLYSLGGFIRKYDPFKKVRTYVFFLVIAVIYVLIYISFYNTTQNAIENYYRSGTTDLFIQSIPDFDNFSFISIVIGVSMFEVFRRIHIPTSRIINFLGKSTFMIYLIHDNSFFYSLWDLRDWITTLYNTPMLFVYKLVKWTLATFAVGVVVYICYCVLSRIFKKCRVLFLKVSR